MGACRAGTSRTDLSDAARREPSRFQTALAAEPQGDEVAGMLAWVAAPRAQRVKIEQDRH